MTDKIVYLPLAIANEIFSHAQSEPDNEVCGLISARGQTICRSYPIHNCAENPARRYVMDPAAQIDALRQMRLGGESLFAIYHSHPSSAAEPSATDIAEANYPQVVYLIISLNIPGVLEIRAFAINNGQTKELLLIIA